jgi:dolichol-phosphate mannosyltransferase
VGEPIQGSAVPVVSIVVPTYREAENLPPLCEAVHQVMMQSDFADYELIVVDDLSPDETVSVARKLSETYPLRLLQPEGRPRDLSLSVLDGIEASAAEIVVVMDADLSHPISLIPELMRLASEGGMVVGSRYVAGGQFDRGWSFWRFLNSFLATRLAAPLTTCRDPMSGFFAVRKTDLGDIKRYRPIGYKIALEIMVRGGFDEVEEVPITFKDRTAGDSKMNLKQQFNYVRHLRRLYLYRYGGFAEFIHYGVVGASGFVVDIAIYYLLQLFGVDHRLARGVSFWPAVSWNWAVNRMTTFGARKRRPRGKQWLEFLITSCLGFCLNWGVYVTLTTEVDFFVEYRLLALIAGILVASLFNFTAATLFVFNEKRN